VLSSEATAASDAPQSGRLLFGRGVSLWPSTKMEPDAAIVCSLHGACRLHKSCPDRPSRRHLGISIVIVHPTDQADLEDALDARPLAKRSVQFDLEAITLHEITPYAEVYGLHPNEFNFGRDTSIVRVEEPRWLLGRSSPFWRPMSDDECETSSSLAGDISDGKGGEDDTMSDDSLDDQALGWVWFVD